MIDHELGHAAVDTDIFTGAEAGLVGAEEQRHFCYVLGFTHSSHGLQPSHSPSMLPMDSMTICSHSFQVVSAISILFISIFMIP